MSTCCRCGKSLDPCAPSQLCSACTSLVGTLSADEFPTTTALPGSPRYELLERLGQGGMGEVYRAYQRDLDRLVALKLIRAEHCDNAAFVARFRREATAMGRLNHPHIVAIHDAGELDGRPYLAMEYVAGVSLRARLRQGVIPSAEALGLAKQLCAAVAYAHALGIVHRDLKPENILLTSTGHIKVADFGLAKLVTASPEQLGLTAEGVVLGTLRYMAPEQLAGAPDVDARADVYSLGVVLYEMLTGQVPVGRFRLPSQLVSTEPLWDRVILRALDAEPGLRFRDAGDLAAALDGPAGGAEDPVVEATREWTAAVTPGNLPALAATFVGREDERQWIRARFASQRLITLTGSGGTGKSRLAIQVGLDVAADYPDGTWFVALAETTDARRVPAAIAAALGIGEDQRDILETLGDHLARRRLLLILDNFEQIVSAAGIVARLLDAAPRLRILVTSRLALRLQGEAELPIGPLPLPDRSRATVDVAACESAPAVRLFVDRAQAVRSNLPLTADNLSAIVEICRRLDGLPLAIELAAARVKLMTPQALAARLTSSLKVLTGGARDLPPRQQTMRATIAWSYDLLTAPQRTLLSWLTVFRGAFSLESAEALVAQLHAAGHPPSPAGGEPLDPADVLDALTALVDHNLLRTVADDPTPRFSLFETIREFGEEQLATPAALARLRQAHADWCLATARHDEPLLTSPTSSAVVAKWDYEMPDFRAALAWWRGPGHCPEAALALVGELWYYWILKQHRREGLEELEATASTPGVPQDSPEFGRVQHALGTLYYVQDRPRESLAAFERALEIRRRHTDESAYFATLGNLAALQRAIGQFSESLQNSQQVIEYYRRSDNRWGLAVALSNAALLMQFVGRDDECESAIDEAIEIYTALNDVRGLSRQYLSRGRVQHADGRFQAACESFERALQLSDSIADDTGRSNSRLALANSHVSLGNLVHAEQLFAQFESDLEPDAPASRRASFLLARGYLHWKSGAPALALAAYRDAMRLRRESLDWYGVGEALVQIVQVYVCLQRFRDAACLLGGELTMRKQVGYRHSKDTDQELREVHGIIESALGTSSMDQVIADAETWPSDRIVSLALDDSGPLT